MEPAQIITLAPSDVPDNTIEVPLGVAKMSVGAQRTGVPMPP